MCSHTLCHTIVIEVTSWVFPCFLEFSNHRDRRVIRRSASFFLIWVSRSSSSFILHIVYLFVSRESRCSSSCSLATFRFVVATTASAQRETFSKRSVICFRVCKSNSWLLLSVVSFLPKTRSFCWTTKSCSFSSCLVLCDAEKWPNRSWRLKRDFSLHERNAFLCVARRGFCFEKKSLFEEETRNQAFRAWTRRRGGDGNYKSKKRSHFNKIYWCCSENERSES